MYKTGWYYAQHVSHEKETMTGGYEIIYLTGIQAFRVGDRARYRVTEFVILKSVPEWVYGGKDA